MSRTGALPTTVIAGYLGAGKTTLVNHLLRHARGERIAVVVNEFGALPIDQDLIEGADGDVLALAGGCICCAVGDDLMAGLSSIVARENIDRLLIEASGVALPDSIVRSLALVRGVRRDAALALVDAETIRAQADDAYIGDTILRQLAAVDLVVVNKTDLVAPETLQALRAWLGERAPCAKLVETRFGALAPEIAFGRIDAGAFVCDEPAPDHDAHGLSAETFDCDGVFDASALAVALADDALGLVRAKGFVLDEDGGWRALQIVGRRADVTAAPPRERGAIVCIAHGRAIDRNAIERMLNTTRSRRSSG